MGMTNIRLATLLLAAGLMPTPPGQQIRGKVTSASHVPVANAKITVVGSGNIAAFSGPDGSYALDGLNPGRYTVLASSPRYWPTSKADVDAGKTADFTLVEKRYFKSTSGIVIADLSMDNAQQFLDSAKMAGDIQAEYLIVNRLLTEQSSDEGLKQLSESLTKALDTQRAQIGGTVINRRGRTLANADVKLTNETTGAVFFTKTNDRGQYQLSVFPVGEYKIEAGTGSQSVSTAIKDPVSPNAKFTHDIRLSEVKDGAPH